MPGVKRPCADALDASRCETCEHYHARGTTCDECGHVRRADADADVDGDGRRARALEGERARRATTVVEVIDRFLLVGAFEHTSSEETLLRVGVRTVINAAPTCKSCCSGRWLSVVNLNTSEEGGAGDLDLRHACERLQSLHARSTSALEIDKSQPVRVLVYCMSGRSRAPTVATAYVMFKMRMSFKDALAYVQSRYPADHRGVKLKDEDASLLERFERELAENPPNQARVSHTY